MKGGAGMSALIKVTLPSGKQISLDANEIFGAEKASSGDTATLVLAAIEVLETCEQVKQKIAHAFKTSRKQRHRECRTERESTRYSGISSRRP
jgi:hypothetical protein